MPDRPAPDVDRGPRRDLPPRARRLVDRSRSLDRAERADARYAAVMEEERRGRRVRRIISTASWSTAIVVFVGGGALAGGVPGAGVGAALLGVAALARASLHRAAAKRGAAAWDWRSRRYVLLGTPASQVRDLDDIEGQPRDALGQRRTGGRPRP